MDENKNSHDRHGISRKHKTKKLKKGRNIGLNIFAMIMFEFECHEKKFMEYYQQAVRTYNLNIYVYSLPLKFKIGGKSRDGYLYLSAYTKIDKLFFYPFFPFKGKTLKFYIVIF